MQNIIFTTRSINHADLIWTNSQYTKGGIEEINIPTETRKISTLVTQMTSIYRRIDLKETKLKRVEEQNWN